MPEALAKATCFTDLQPRPWREPPAVPDILPRLQEAPLPAPNDNEVEDEPLRAELRRGEAITFEIPGRIWGAMLACYGVFFTAILAATGGSGHALFAIAISVLYAAVYFGAARIVSRQAGPQPRSPLDGPGRVLQTCYGPMREGAVAAQMLVVPAAIALFAIGILIVRLAVVA